MTLPYKFVLGAFSLSSIGGLSYFGITYFQNNNKLEKRTINDLINEEFEYILLNTTSQAGNEDQKHWDAIWENYKNQNNTDNDIFNLFGWSQRGDKNLTDLLKNKCKDLSKSKIETKSESIYTNITKYCAREVTIKYEIEKLKLLSLDAKNGKDQTIWEKRVSKKEDLKNHFESLNISFGDVDIAKVKAGCTDVISKTKKDEKYSIILEAYKTVCVKQSDELEK